MTNKDEMGHSIQDYFTEKITTYGANFSGVGWNSSARQELCFRQLIRICENPATGTIADNFSINDYGCGYGALIKYLVTHNYKFSSYTGFDITKAMTDQAQELFKENKNYRFINDENALMVADYTIASGLLSLKLDNDKDQWEKYVLKLLDKFWKFTKKGLAFNSLTKYSDFELMRPELYYPDPCFLFDYCKTKLSKNVTLLHDYGVYEFTILVRKDI